MTLDLAHYARQPRLTDSAWGTELQKRGLVAGSAPELWNWKNPDEVQAVAASYVQAGSDIILTNTFGANRFVLAPHGLKDKVAEFAEAGVAVSRKAAAAAGKNVLVFASLGPRARS